MFRGVNTLNLDAKGRMAMPTRFREQLQESSEGHLIVTIDTDDRCLLIYPLPDWEQIEAQLIRMANMNPQARRVQRLLMGHATDTELDGSGRLLVPPPLRTFARLDKRVVLIGQGKKLELWDEDHWIARREVWLAETNMVGGELAPELATLSL